MATGILQGGLAWDEWGLLAGLAAAVCFATYFLVGEHGVAELDPLRVVLWSFGIAAVAMNVVSPVWEFPAGCSGPTPRCSDGSTTWCSPRRCSSAGW